MATRIVPGLIRNRTMRCGLWTIQGILLYRIPELEGIDIERCDIGESV